MFDKQYDKSYMIDEYGYEYYTKSKYLDLDGNPVERTKDKYPYSYDAYVTWKDEYNLKTSHAQYSDRLFQFNSRKYNESCRTVWGDERQIFNNSSPQDIEKFLSLYYDKEIKLTAIMEGCNVSNGYPYWVFFFEDKTL